MNWGIDLSSYMLSIFGGISAGGLRVSLPRQTPSLLHS